MTTLIIKTGDEAEFFSRGRKIAQLADQKRPLPTESVISFEDPADVLKLLTVARLALFRAIKEKPGSISAISERLHRDRSAVKRDVDQLAKVGLVRVELCILPGHGRMKEVSVAAQRFKLEALLA
ncbi:MarR family transcriptional regulator [Duganella sp. BJB488]|uniref:HVO_A0114 family putative DNA-binding protein n=1 Tax=unclassified Duganella TaxID=2636909 RepID=UPI000E3407D5|nr:MULTISPECIES: helix-turn-helix domain-containing protein [unclassified Duganella]RFP09231.1 MarR family transcriptional regulator [Duganella sp. BJB475]RFP13115.1 MarR family transcriptional regulator [Duganella sp. BJB489]RFP17121.1 MarR family transcriptional regulator [Duganella sp. BJB488]RFP25457.1 MarR family transcriptional regulator [Duganella sp. BJB476]RFP31660.1 MarR family transcriptional regulator [Duganella sp. BJB480]